MSRSIETFVRSATNKTLIKVILSDKDTTFKEPIITFYSMCRNSTKWQHIADYLLSTFKASDPRSGLAMYGGEIEWTISSETKRYLQKWIEDTWSVALVESTIPESFFEIFTEVLNYNMGLWLKVHPMVVYNTTSKHWSILPITFKNIDSNELFFEFREFHDYFEDPTSNSPNPDNFEKRYIEFIESTIRKKEFFEKLGG